MKSTKRKTSTSCRPESKFQKERWTFPPASSSLTSSQSTWTSSPLMPQSTHTTSKPNLKSLLTAANSSKKSLNKCPMSLRRKSASSAARASWSGGPDNVIKFHLHMFSSQTGANPRGSNSPSSCFHLSKANSSIGGKWLSPMKASIMLNTSSSNYFRGNFTKTSAALATGSTSKETGTRIRGTAQSTKVIN